MSCQKENKCMFSLPFSDPRLHKRLFQQAASRWRCLLKHHYPSVLVPTFKRSREPGASIFDHVEQKYVNPKND